LFIGNEKFIETSQWDVDRVRERLEFEAAAEAIEKGKETVIPSSILSFPGMNLHQYCLCLE
jgi:hypothetical protein